MSNGASSDGADNSQYNRPEDSEMSVHDRLGDDARDQPNENIPNEVQHPDSFRCAATLMLRMQKGEKLYPKPSASPFRGTARSQLASKARDLHRPFPFRHMRLTC